MKNKKLVKLVSAIVLTLTLTCLAAPVALAQPTVDPSKVKNLEIEAVITRVINWALGILVLVTALMIIIAGILWVTAGGDDTKIGKARGMLMAGVTGLIISLVAYGIIRVVTTVILG